MLYEIEQAVFERFPGYARMAVVAEGVDNTREIPELAELLAQCEEGVRRDDLEDFWHVPVLETWAEAFSGMGIKPKKNPPSVINLVKRCRAGKPLPFINPLVAIFNCISLKYLLPCGGDDRNVIEGDLRLGIADGTENYVPLGQPDMLEHPQPGEVIYYDTATKDVFCRAWCWKNGNRSKLMPETTNAVINVDAMPPLPLATAEQAASLEPRRPSISWPPRLRALRCDDSYPGPSPVPYSRQDGFGRFSGLFWPEGFPCRYGEGERRVPVLSVVPARRWSGMLRMGHPFFYGVELPYGKSSMSYRGYGRHSVFGDPP